MPDTQPAHIGSQGGTRRVWGFQITPPNREFCPLNIPPIPRKTRLFWPQNNPLFLENREMWYYVYIQDMMLLKDQLFHILQIHVNLLF